MHNIDEPMGDPLREMDYDAWVRKWFPHEVVVLEDTFGWTMHLALWCEEHVGPYRSGFFKKRQCWLFREEGGAVAFRMVATLPEPARGPNELHQTRLAAYRTLMGGSIDLDTIEEFRFFLSNNGIQAADLSLVRRAFTVFQGLKELQADARRL